jgi:hypothetical protein
MRERALSLARLEKVRILGFEKEKHLTNAERPG